MSKKLGFLQRVRDTYHATTGTKPPTNLGQRVVLVGGGEDPIIVHADRSDRRINQDTSKLWEMMAKPINEVMHVPATSLKTIRGDSLPDYRIAPLNQSEIQQVKVKNYKELPLQVIESDVGMATTTPLLGQYSSYFGWPDDWCLSKDSMVITNPTPKKVSSVNVGDRVLSSDGKFHSVLAVLPKPYNGGMLRFKVHRLSPFPIEVTPDHRCLIVTHKEYERVRKTNREPIPVWMEAKDIKKGDFFVFPIIAENEDTTQITLPSTPRKSSRTISLTDGLLWLIGLYMAEGSCDHDGIHLSLNSNERDIINKLIEIAKSDLGLTTRVHLDKRCNGVTVNLFDRNFVSFITDNFGKAETKHLPLWVLRLPKNRLQQVFEGWYDGDGDHGKRPQHAIKTSSKVLAWQLYLASMKVYGNGSIIKGTTEAFGGVYDSYRMGFFRSPHKSFPYSFGKINPVLEIEPFQYNDLRYDLTVEGQHDFVTTCGVVHNCFYWEYLSCRLLIQEVKYALLIKNWMMWRSGWEIDGPDDDVADELEEKLRQTDFDYAAPELSLDAMLYGTSYAEIASDSKAKWALMSYMANPQLVNTLYMSNVNLESYKDATEIYGLKQLDPRTMRVEVDPSHFDNKQHRPTVIKYVQRRWQGPLSQPATQPQTNDAIQNTEIYFAKDQIFQIRFNRISGGIYGRSMISEVYWALKAYLIMLQYIPAIFAKRADPALLFKFGGEVLNDAGQKYTKYPRDKSELDLAKEPFLNRAPTEDLFSDLLVQVEEIYKSSKGTLQGLNELLSVWKERVLIFGLGIPPVLSETRIGAVRWGDLKYQTVADEIRNMQREFAHETNLKLMPVVRLGVKDGDKYRFRFKEVQPDDRLAKARAFLPIVQFGIANKEWFRQELDIPEQYAEGAEPMMGLSANPLRGGIGGFTSNPNRDNMVKSPNAKGKGSEQPKMKAPPDERPKLSAPNPKGKRESIVLSDEASGALE